LLPFKLAQGERGTEAVPDVAVVITTYNHARYLGEALDSVLAQTAPARQIIVVDDGSSDAPEQVTARYPRVRLLRQANAGLSAARNAGLVLADTTYVIFLDADDRLHPTAIEAGLGCFRSSPNAAFVYGAHQRIDGNSGIISEKRYSPVGTHPFEDLLRGNCIGMNATVMFRREPLLDAYGFDPDLRRCEDYEIYLRLAKDHPVASHSNLVGDYRWHGNNMSLDRRAMLGTVLNVHRRFRKAAEEQHALAAWRAGRGVWRDYYWREMQAAARCARETGIRPNRREQAAAAAGLAPARIRAAGARLARAAAGLPLWSPHGDREQQLGTRSA
jgi:glycosyltransferase involved in cell wall biosynthesis